MGTIFSAAQITRFEAQGEENFFQDRPCVVEREGLALVAGTAEYSIPSYISDIRRITYLGWKVYPLPHRDLRQSYLSGTQQSRPYWYIINNIGQNKIRFFPVPSASIVDTTTTAGIWGPDIISNCVIEFFKQPNQTTSIMPEFIRRQYLKNYINKRCFEVDARGSNLKNVKYWADKVDFLTTLYIDLLDDLNNKPRNLVCSDSAQRPYGYTPPPPILPINRYGISVDEPGY